MITFKEREIYDYELELDIGKSLVLTEVQIEDIELIDALCTRIREGWVSDSDGLDDLATVLQDEGYIKQVTAADCVQSYISKNLNQAQKEALGLRLIKGQL